MNAEEDWYVVDRGGRRHGPYDRAVIDALHGRGELQPDTPVWHPGLAHWQPASRLLRFRPDAEPAGAGSAGRSSAGLSSAGSSSSGAAAAAVPGQVPMRRPVAKPRADAKGRLARVKATTSATSATATAAAAATAAARGTDAPALNDAQDWAQRRVAGGAFDLLLLALLLRIPFFVQPEASPWPARITDNLTLPLLAIWAALDAWMLSSLGTTPGRWLFGVRVTDAGGGKLTLQRAGMRAVLIAVTGLAAGLELLILPLMFFAWTQLRTTGTVWWDRAAQAVVAYDTGATARQTAGRVLLAAIVLLHLAGARLLAEWR